MLVVVGGVYCIVGVIMLVCFWFVSGDLFGLFGCVVC